MSPQTKAQAVDTVMVDPGPEHSLFDEAVEAIKTTVTEQYQRGFRANVGVATLFEDLSSICDQNVKEQRRLLVCNKKVAFLARTFAPYFDLLSICIQVRPSWCEWLWGLLRLVFRLGCNYVLFLEKVTDMFETIAHILPQYQRLKETCSNQGRFLNQSQDDRLAVLLSYVYADIIQFCLDAYCMFSRGSQGVSSRHPRLSSPTILWRPLDSRFAQLEARLVKHREWIEGEFKVQVNEHAAIARYRREYIEFLDEQAVATENSERVEERMARRMRRVDKVKAWLAHCCAYRDIYEHRIQQRYPKSCAWFLDTDQYCRWKNAPFVQSSASDAYDLEGHWQDRILFVQANSGFGKSFISGAVIDDLNTEVDNLNIADEHEPPATIFFHFNASHSYCIHPNDAFRALAYQLVHIHRNDRSTLDAISLIMRKTPPQSKASSDDVLNVLSLLLQQHPTFMVIDGIDECSDVSLFLESLPEACRRSDARIILFSRPEIQIPNEYQRWASDTPHIVALNEESNKQDIETYVTETLSHLALQGFFGINMNRSLILQIAERSKGTFLWASLLLKYLKSPGLSPDERRVALENAHSLDGLESIYRHILAMLDLRPQREKQIVANIFRWLPFSINRLCIPALEVALAITPGQRTTESSFVPNVMDSIPRLTCGLVEVTNCSVVFTHRSVKDFLQSPELKDSSFSLCEGTTVHAHLAARCLSYLAHDVPKRPLGRLQPHTRPAPISFATSSAMSMRTSISGDSGYKSMSSASDSEGLHPSEPSATGATVISQQPIPAFDAAMPFLRYASLCWPIHLTRALANASNYSRIQSRKSVDPFEQTPWLPSLSTFLTDRSAVTAWVEASWRYNLPPSLSRLVPLLNTLKSEIPPATVEGREIRWVVQGIRELSEALNELKAEYATTLRENPSLIWQWSGAGRRQISSNGPIAAGSGSHAGRGFWPVWDDRVGRVQGVVL